MRKSEINSRNRDFAHWLQGKIGAKLESTEEPFEGAQIRREQWSKCLPNRNKRELTVYYHPDGHVDIVLRVQKQKRTLVDESIAIMAYLGEA